MLISTRQRWFAVDDSYNYNTKVVWLSIFQNKIDNDYSLKLMHTRNSVSYL